MKTAHLRKAKNISINPQTTMPPKKETKEKLIEEALSEIEEGAYSDGDICMVDASHIAQKYIEEAYIAGRQSMKEEVLKALEEVQWLDKEDLNKIN